MRRWLIATFAVITVAAFLAGPLERASAEATGGSHNFCNSMWLQPFGHDGDRCSAGHENWGHIMMVSVQTYERAGCVNYQGWYYEYYRSWACGPSNATTWIEVPQDGGSYMGIIRNNNLSYAAKFSGGFVCCWVY
jgi:hypothetical protein